jgi:hypothetical protein
MPPRPWSRNSGSSWLSQSSCFGHLSIPVFNLRILRISFGDTYRCVPSFLAGFPARSAEADLAFFPAFPDCLSWGCPKIALPPYKFRESSPSLPAPERACCLRLSTARYSTPSALVVPPDFDGLLLTEPRRFIAPCIQPWGSSRFLPRLPSVTLQLPIVLAAIPDSPFTPSRAFPSYTAALRHRSRCLLAVILVPSPFQSLTEVNHLPDSSP